MYCLKLALPFLESIMAVYRIVLSILLLGANLFILDVFWSICHVFERTILLVMKTTYADRYVP